MTNYTNPETIALHASFRGDPSTGSVAVPMHQTTSFQFPDVETACARFALQELGPIYSRIGNPTTDVLEQRMAVMEGGVASLAVSSGQAATALSIQNIAATGDNIVSSTDLYGGSWNLFANTFKTMGIEVRFVDPTDPENFRRATDERTRAYYAETLPNPKLQVFPISDVAAIAEEIGVPLIMDNTAAPILCRPFDFGAHIVVYSTTKFIGGHGTSIGGMIIDGGQFDWEKHADRFPMLTMPDPSYHGAIWTEATKPMGPVAYIIKARVTMLRDLGPCMSPFNAFQFIQGLETLPLRMREHTKNAQAVADYLSQNDKVETVIHPSQMEGVKKRWADQHMPKGFGGLVGFEIKGGRDAGLRFIDALEMVYHVANIGDTRTLALHPATSTHQQLTPDQQLAAGVTPGYIRLSVGIEHIDDILADVSQALEKTSA
ncbi:PLP-dependent transferase [Sneathiella marina]|uniref:PLP-dependent transferase n=1 Tax=Sneathiella marina TaxID=2950108 RepID=A0ABY4W6D8_9PROT|nr:PLP-dependent transferase [Sneathiella marina]USG60859.1 PLP-dependent transferase [Sneathiella marina]